MEPDMMQPIQIHLMLFFIVPEPPPSPDAFSIQIHLMLFFIRIPEISFVNALYSNTSHVILYRIWASEFRKVHVIQIHLMLFFIRPLNQRFAFSANIQIHLMLFFIPRISAFSYITIPQASLYFNILSFFTSRICFPAKFFVSSSYSLYFRDSV